jgi:hypothetical protein
VNITVFTRYCHRQCYSLESALQELGRRRERHPDDDVFIEHNERSQAKPYRIVRMREKVVQIPDAPGEVPEYPKPVALPDDEVNIAVENVRVEAQNRWQQSYNQNWITATHTPSGTQAKRSFWYSKIETAPKWVIKGIRDELERKLDPTWDDRLAQYTKESAEFRQGREEWAKAAKQEIVA